MLIYNGGRRQAPKMLIYNGGRRQAPQRGPLGAEPNKHIYIYTS